MVETETQRVLVVDEPALLDTFSTILEPQYDVETAVDGTSALETLDEQIDVVVLERRLPDLPGEELLPKIRSRPGDCQVVCCSAVVPDVDIIALPLDDYLLKPVGREKLRKAIERQLLVANRSTTVQEYLAVHRKRAAIEAANSTSKLQESEAYRELCTTETKRSREIQEHNRSQESKGGMESRETGEDNQSQAI